MTVPYKSLSSIQLEEDWEVLSGLKEWVTDSAHTELIWFHNDDCKIRLWTHSSLIIYLIKPLYKNHSYFFPHKCMSLVSGGNRWIMWRVKEPELWGQSWVRFRTLPIIFFILGNLLTSLTMFPWESVTFSSCFFNQKDGKFKFKQMISSEHKNNIKKICCMKICHVLATHNCNSFLQLGNIHFMRGSLCLITEAENIRCSLYWLSWNTQKYNPGSSNHMHHKIWIRS